jgi:hypothetical protein
MGYLFACKARMPTAALQGTSKTAGGIRLGQYTTTPDVGCNNYRLLYWGFYALPVLLRSAG